MNEIKKYCCGSVIKPLLFCLAVAAGGILPICGGIDLLISHEKAGFGVLAIGLAVIGLAYAFFYVGYLEDFKKFNKICSELKAMGRIKTLEDDFRNGSRFFNDQFRMGRYYAVGKYFMILDIKEIDMFKRRSETKIYKSGKQSETNMYIDLFSGNKTYTSCKCKPICLTESEWHSFIMTIRKNYDIHIDNNIEYTTKTIDDRTDGGD